jgi:hypothetical protein
MNSPTNNRLAIRNMAQAPPRPMRRTWLPRLLTVVNVPMRVILRLPFDTPLSKQLMLLSFTGRKTGTRYRQPVSYVPDGDTLLTPGGGKWKLNLREDQPIVVRLRGRDVQARPQVIGDVAEVERLLQVMRTRNPRVTAFVPVTGPDGQIDRTKVETAVRYGFRIIRWHFDQPPMQQDSSETGEPHEYRLSDRRRPASRQRHGTSVRRSRARSKRVVLSQSQSTRDGTVPPSSPLR